MRRNLVAALRQDVVASKLEREQNLKNSILRGSLICIAVTAMFAAGCANGPLAAHLQRSRLGAGQNANAYAQPWETTTAAAYDNQHQRPGIFGGRFQQQAQPCTVG